MHLRRQYVLKGLVTLVVALGGTVSGLDAQQPVTLTGTVTTDDGQPIAAASILISDLNLQTLSNDEGRFLMLVPASRAVGQQVAVSASIIGRRTATETVTLTSGTITINFSLGADPLRLEEIVVTGVGLEMERAKLGVTINQVDAEEIMQSNETNIVAALAGKAPNVEVTSSGGDPGGGAYIRIRGANSLIGSNQPLIVVDGMPINNSSTALEFSGAGTAINNRAADLNPADIEDIQILKGAAAAAVYGSRAANGVVLITTKSGRPGTNNVSYSVSYSSDEVNRLQPLNTRFGQGFRGQAGVGSPFSWGPELAAGTPIFDHAGEVYQTGNRLDQQLTWSGGSEQTTYYLSLGRTGQEGVIAGNSSYTRTSVRLKGSHAFRDDLKLTANFAYTESFSELIQRGSNISGVQLGALRTPPDFNNRPYLNENGLHRSYRNPNPETLTERRGYDNPFWIANEMPNTAEVGRTFGNVTLDYTPFNWLKVNYTLGVDYSADERRSVFPKSSSDFPNGRLIRADLVNMQIDHNLVATVTRDLTDNISGALTVGQNLNQREYRRYQVNGQNLIFGTNQLDFTVDKVPNEYTETVRTDGYFVQGTIDMWRQLYLTGGVRYDGSSTFGGKDQRFAYPKASAAWDLTQYVNNSTGGLLSFAKARVAFGITGKQPPVFSNVNAFNKATITDGWLSPNGLETIYMGNEGVISEGTLGNKNIKPERTKEYEFGADLAFFDNRLSLGATYYYQKTTDAILRVDVPPSTGFNSKFANAAEFENRGFELTASLSAIDTRSVQWAIEGQWARNRSCVLNLAGTEEIGLSGFSGGTSSVVAPKRDAAGNITKCYSIGALFGDDFIRFGNGSRSDGGVMIDDAYPGWQAGDIFIGPDGFPQYDPQERVAGDPNPDWTASIRNTITVFDNLRISGLIDIKKGGDMWNGTKGALYYFGAHKDTEPYHGDGAPVVFGAEGPNSSNATIPGQSVFGPGAGQTVTVGGSYFWGNIGSGFTGPFSQFVEPAGYVKLRDISISYTLRNQDWMDRLGFSSAILTLSGRNLKTWTDYTGIDPESNLNGQSLGRGLEYFNNPQTRSFVVGVTLNRNN
ncbi:MAG: SusC/RagA family TonB-linked outer membrane protein [Gemmatimonadota bacterium]|nr:MAG: SusC/RagA family TonB-linked outer membrane protein [Gemmatimonadota bacterium]